MSYTQPQRPLKVFRAGTVKVAIWRRQGQEIDRPTFSIRLQKSYFDQDAKKWIDTDYLFPEDLPKVEAAIRAAYEFTTLKEEDPSNESPSADTGQ